MTKLFEKASGPLKIIEIYNSTREGKKMDGSNDSLDKAKEKYQQRGI